MIKVQELRVGNIVSVIGFNESGQGSKIKAIISFGDTFGCRFLASDGSNIDVDGEGIIGIELTPELLYKLGFEKRAGKEGYEYRNNKISFGYLDSDSQLFIEYNCDSTYRSMRISTLHQLQNIYFALTSEELIYKP